MSEGPEPYSRLSKPAIAPDDDGATLPFEPGQLLLGKYQLTRHIGTGGVGFVMAARHLGFDDLVALKFLRPQFTRDELTVDRFKAEARASFRLRSAHVARVLDVDAFEGLPFIAMELLEGFDVRTLLDRHQRFDVEIAVDCALQICDALAAAHALGLIHRDIKPENLFLVEAGVGLGEIKVLDFGISTAAMPSDQVARARSRTALGTPPYMSPEQIRAAASLDHRSDIWSLGCVIYELLTGIAPFDRVSIVQSFAAVLDSEPAQPYDLRREVPEALSDVVMRCLRKQPDERFADVAELAQALAPFGSGRFANYPERCRAVLAAVGRRSRASANTLVSSAARRLTGTVGVPRSMTQSVALRRPTNAPTTRRMTYGPLGLPTFEPVPPNAIAARPANLPTRTSTTRTTFTPRPPVVVPMTHELELPSRVIPKYKPLRMVVCCCAALVLAYVLATRADELFHEAPALAPNTATAASAVMVEPLCAAPPCEQTR